MQTDPTRRNPHDVLKARADGLGTAAKELVVLTHQSDPFNCGTPADMKAGEWFATIYEALGLPRGLHLRDIHYAIVVRALPRVDGTTYVGNDRDWVALKTAFRKARALALVEWGWFTEARTQAEENFDEVRAPAEYPAWVYKDGAAEFELERPELVIPEWEIVTPVTASLHTALNRQPLALEIMVEKDSAAVNAEVYPLAEAFGARVVIGTGFQAQTKAYELVQRSLADGRPRVLLFLSDADARGDAMPVATARHIEFMTRVDHPECPRIVVDVLALTLAQVAEINADLKKAGKVEIPVTPDEGREQGRVELQALAAFVPGWIGGELERRLDELTDHDLADELVEWETDADEQVAAEWDEVIGVSAEALTAVIAQRDEILKGDPTISVMREKFNELRPERRRIVNEVRAIAENFDPDLPEPPEGFVDLDADGREWLLDTDRDELAQLDIYRKVQGRGPLVMGSTVCECGCGEEALGIKRFFNETHAKRVLRAEGGAR